MLIFILGLSCIRCLHEDTIKDHVKQNINVIASEDNIIGQGCSANLYEFSLHGLNFVLKLYSDQKRCRREIRLLERLSKINLPFIPRTHLTNVTDGIVVTDKLDMIMRTYLRRNIKHRDLLGVLLTDLFNALTMLHQNGIVHGDIHMSNIMIQDGRVFLIDFGDSFFSTDPTLDFLRLKHRVLAHIENWEELILREKLNNPRSLEVIEKIYADPGISRIFEMADFFNAPAIQYWIYKPLSLFTNLPSLVLEYNDTINFN